MRIASLVSSSFLKTAFCAVLFFIGVFFVSLSPADASTNKSGTISSNQTWDVAGSPYIVVDTVYVSTGVTLTIDAGVTVKFEGGVSDYISVEGTLDVNGTGGSNVVFTGLNDTTAGEWYGMEFLSGSTGDFSNTIIRYGGKTCTSCGMKEKMIKNVGGTLTFDDSSILNSLNYAIHQTSGSVTMTDGIIDGNVDGIYYDSGTMSFTDDVEIKDLIDVQSTATSLTITDSDLNTGTVYASAPFTFTGNTLTTATIRIKRLSIFTHSGNTVVSGNKGYFLDGQTAGDSTLTAESGLVYLIDAPFYILAGHTVTIEQDAVFKFTDTTNDFISIAGTVEAKGTGTDPIYFTSYKDDNAGGDTNNDNTSTSAAAGDWYGIEVTSGGVGNFAGTVFNYGGKWCSSCQVKEKMIQNNGGILNFYNSSITNSLNYAIHQIGGGASTMMSDGFVDGNIDGIYYNAGTMSFMDDVQIKDFIDAQSTTTSLSIIDSYLNTGTVDAYGPFTFTGNELYNATVKIKRLSTFIHSGNTISGGVNAYYLSGQTLTNATLSPESGMVYLVDGDFSVDAGDTLNIAAGTVIKFLTTSAWLPVEGTATLNVNGTPTNPVYFTSYKDDTVGDDTNNNDSANSPAAGDWGKIQFASGSYGNITHAVIRYGGYAGSSTNQRMVENLGGTVNITDTDLVYSYRYPFYQTTAGTTTFLASTLTNSIVGAYITHGTVDIIGSQIGSNSQTGVFVTGGTVSISGSTISSNTSYGVYSTGTAVDAEGNYWGHSSGPTHASNSGGSGDDVSDYVDFDPFETALESTAPSLSIASPVTDEVLISATATVEGTVSDGGSGVAEVRVNGVLCAIDTGDWTCTGVAIAPGTNTFRASAWDNAGNRSDTSVSIERKVPVLVLPGIAGTHLYDNDQSDQTWLDLTQMTLDIGDEFLVESLSLDSNGNSINDIQTLDVVRDVAGYYDILEDLITELENNGYTEDSPDQSLFVFPYDWRLDLRLIETNLNVMIESILSETGSDQVDLVAHSMGGLLAKQYAEERGGTKVRKLVFIGTPHLGAPYAAEALLYGTDFDIPVLAEEAVRDVAINAPAVYELLPSPKYISDIASYINIDDSPDIAYNYADSISYLDVDRDRNSYLLGEAEEYHQQNLEYLDYKQIQTHYIVACNTPTVGGYVFNPSTGAITLTGWLGGDETVPYQSANFGSAPGLRKYYISDDSVSHASMSSEEIVREAVAEILTESGTSAVSALDADTTNCGLTGDSMTWMSPVDIHIYDSEGRHTGPNHDGGVDREIPGIGYKILDHYKFVFLPDNGETYSVLAIGTDSGTFDLRLTSYDSNHITGTSVFNDVPVNVNSRVSFERRSNNIAVKVLKAVDPDGTVKNYRPFAELIPGLEQDLVVPTTEVSVETVKPGNREISIYSNDIGSGVATILYSIDGAPYVEYSGPILFSDGAEHDLRYYAIDKAGNNEKPKAYQITTQ